MAMVDTESTGAGGVASSGVASGRSVTWSSNAATGGAPKKASAAERIGIGRPR